MIATENLSIKILQYYSTNLNLTNQKPHRKKYILLFKKVECSNVKAIKAISISTVFLLIKIVKLMQICIVIIPYHTITIL